MFVALSLSSGLFIFLIAVQRLMAKNTEHMHSGVSGKRERGKKETGSFKLWALQAIARLASGHEIQ